MSLMGRNCKPLVGMRRGQLAIVVKEGTKNVSVKFYRRREGEPDLKISHFKKEELLYWASGEEVAKLDELKVSSNPPPETL